MKKINKILMPLILSFIGGFLDIYAISYRGGKFCFLQTGNLIYIANDLINNNLNSVYIGLFIFLAFTIGLIIANLLTLLLKKKAKEEFIQILLLGLVFLLVIPNYFFSKSNNYFELSYIGIFSLGLIGGILLESFRFSYLAYTATMMTNNYKLFWHSLISGICEKNKIETKKAFVYFLIIIAFILGVTCFSLCYKYDIIMQYIIFIPHFLILILLIREIRMISIGG